MRQIVSVCVYRQSRDATDREIAGQTLDMSWWQCCRHTNLFLVAHICYVPDTVYSHVRIYCWALCAESVPSICEQHWLGFLCATWSCVENIFLWCYTRLYLCPCECLKKKTKTLHIRTGQLCGIIFMLSMIHLCERVIVIKINDCYSLATCVCTVHCIWFWDEHDECSRYWFGLRK